MIAKPAVEAAPPPPPEPERVVTMAPLTVAEALRLLGYRVPVAPRFVRPARGARR